MFYILSATIDNKLWPLKVVNCKYGVELNICLNESDLFLSYSFLPIPLLLKESERSRRLATDQQFLAMSGADYLQLGDPFARLLSSLVKGKDCRNINLL